LARYASTKTSLLEVLRRCTLAHLVPTIHRSNGLVVATAADASDRPLLCPNYPVRNPRRCL